MKLRYQPELDGTYLEDSHFLGLTVEGRDLRLKMLFALTIDHDAYATPLPGEQHCYRDGSILVERPSILDWKQGQARIITDPGGSMDLGSLFLHGDGRGRYLFETEWFAMTVESPGISVHLEDGEHRG